MADESKTETSKPADSKKPSPRETALENALRDAIVMIEDQAVRLQRMSIHMKGTAEWVEMARKLVNEPK